MGLNLKRIFGRSSNEDDFVEIDLNSAEKKDNKVVVQPFVLRHFDDVNDILNSLREGYTIAVIDIKPLKTRDLIELKRAISKVKKTVEAMEGQIAGFGETTIIASPSFAEIGRVAEPKAKPKADFLS